MIESIDLPSSLLIAYSAYAVGVASPGPSNLAIMGTAMAQGRSQALVLALGVISGSVFWGCAAAFGLSSLMQTYSWSLVLMKILGGCYLLWLSAKALRAGMRPSAAAPAQEAGAAGYGTTYLRGLAMHLTNPKAIFVWLSIVALAVPQGAGHADALRVVAGCGLIGAGIFCSYALLFSTDCARRVYRATHRWFSFTVSAVFAYAGVRLIFGRGST